jgi:hypothetical protein
MSKQSTKQFRLVIDVDYCMNKAKDRDIRSQLEFAAEHLAGNGLLSGGTVAEVEKWTYRVDNGKPKVYVVMGLLGGLLEYLVVTTDLEAARKAQKDLDNSLGIEREPDGNYEHDENDCWLREVELDSMSMEVPEWIR